MSLAMGHLWRLQEKKSSTETRIGGRILGHWHTFLYVRLRADDFDRVREDCLVSRLSFYGVRGHGSILEEGVLL